MRFTTTQQMHSQGWWWMRKNRFSYRNVGCRKLDQTQHDRPELSTNHKHSRAQQYPICGEKINQFDRIVEYAGSLIRHNMIDLSWAQIISTAEQSNIQYVVRKWIRLIIISQAHGRQLQCSQNIADVKFRTFEEIDILRRDCFVVICAHYTYL